MSSLRRFTSLALAATFALGISGAGAQDDSTSTLDDLTQFEGLDSAVARSWSVDFAALYAETPEDGEDPLADLEGTWFIYGVVLDFEDDDHASDAYETFHDIEDEEWAADVSEEEGVTEITREDIDDLGDEAFGVTMVSTAEDGGTYRLDIARQDDHMFMAMAIGTTEDDLGSADDLIDHLVNEGEDGGDEEFDPAGGSTGGLWDFFPDDDHEAVENLVPAGDEILFPVPDGEE